MFIPKSKPAILTPANRTLPALAGGELAAHPEAVGTGYVVVGVIV
jgi:hypothetical protein